jgi:ferritin-like metal-binding protein YciE
MGLSTLKDLYVEELKDLYNAENQLLKALPKMAKAASDPKLKESFQTHLTQTEGHVSRLTEIFDALGEKPTGKVCKAMQGLVAEGSEMIEETAAPAVKDAGLIAAAQRVEHYEMAGYGCVKAYAEALGEMSALKLLDKTYGEEAKADQLLTKIAEGVINQKALASKAA